jgi:hypothetical protein
MATDDGTYFNNLHFKSPLIHLVKFKSRKDAVTGALHIIFTSKVIFAIKAENPNLGVHSCPTDSKTKSPKE